MELKKIIEIGEDTVEFTGTLEGEELQAVIEVGLNTLFRHGALPFQIKKEKNLASIAFPISDTPS